VQHIEFKRKVRARILLYRKKDILGVHDDVVIHYGQRGGLPTAVRPKILFHIKMLRLLTTQYEPLHLFPSSPPLSHVISSLLHNVCVLLTGGEIWMLGVHTLSWYYPMFRAMIA
jgi:hypothetical protein